MSSKGSKPRTFSVDRDKFSENWDKIFNKNKKNNKVNKQKINTNK
jgi:hypothetical protein